MSIILAVITIIISLAALFVALWPEFRKYWINKTWRKFIFFYKNYTILFPSSMKYKHSFNNNVINDLWQQGILYLSVHHWFFDIKDNYTNLKNYAILEMKSNLKEETIWNIFKSYFFWNKLNKKIIRIIKIIEKTNLLKIDVSDDNFYEKEIRYDTKYKNQIIKQKISLISSIDQLKLWKSRVTISRPELEEFNLNFIENERNKRIEKYKQELNNNDFVLSVNFGINDYEEFCSCLIGTFSIYFNDNKFTKIESIFHVKEFLCNNKNKTIEEHLCFFNECLEILEDILKIENINDIFSDQIHHSNFKYKEKIKPKF